MKKFSRYIKCSWVYVLILGVPILFSGIPQIMAQEAYLPLPAAPVPGTSWTPLGFLMFGVMLGVLGQVARVAVGIKKELDDPKAQTAKWSTWFNTPELVVSLLLGGASGAICCATLWGDTIDKKFVIACVAAGYAGSDFIQGFVQTYVRSPLPAPTPAPSPNLPPGPPPSAQPPNVHPAADDGKNQPVAGHQDLKPAQNQAKAN